MKNLDHPRVFHIAVATLEGRRAKLIFGRELNIDVELHIRYGNELKPGDVKFLVTRQSVSKPLLHARSWRRWD